MFRSPSALVIGGGPAGLMAAEALAGAGVPVTVADAKPSVARKFLMAGKSGLNLTRNEAAEAFRETFAEAAPWLAPMLDGFGPAEVAAWAEGLGQPVFTGTTGRVFPVAMKASPLLRAWLARLTAQGVAIATRWRWTGWDADGVLFDTPQGPRRVTPDVTVLATGGASWPRLGSDGGWTAHLPPDTLAPFRPANAGLAVDWSPQMARHFGAPVKGTRLCAGTHASRGEWTITARGIEGGGIYDLFRHVRDGAPLCVDLLPDLSETEVARRLARPHGKASLANHLRRALRLDPVRRALLMEFARPLPDAPALAGVLKALPIWHAGPGPIDAAISTAGGVRRAALDDGLMFRHRPGTFAAGEMLDWEAPTGGYLLTACFATGRHAGEAAVRWLQARDRGSPQTPADAS